MMNKVIEVTDENIVVKTTDGSVRSFELGAAAFGARVGDAVLIDNDNNKLYLDADADGKPDSAPSGNADLSGNSGNANNITVNLGNQHPGMGYGGFVGGHSIDKTTYILVACVGFLGIAGIHRMMTGRVGTGLLWFITIGWLGIGTLIDVINGASRKTDPDGKIWF